MEPEAKICRCGVDLRESLADPCEEEEEDTALVVVLGKLPMAFRFND